MELLTAFAIGLTFAIGLFQILFMDRIPASAAVNTAVDLARTGKTAKATGFVNAVLRNALRQRRLERRNRRLLEQLTRDTEILGTSAAAERLRSQVAAAAATATTRS